MKNHAQGFAIRKHHRDLQRLRRLLASLFKVVLLVTALGLFWRWNHDPGVGPIFLSERKLATANTAHFVSFFGLSGSAALIAAGLKSCELAGKFACGRTPRNFQPQRLNSWSAVKATSPRSNHDER